MDESYDLSVDNIGRNNQVRALLTAPTIWGALRGVGK